MALCGLLLAVGIAVLATAQAQAAQYKMVLCAANNGSNNYAVATNTTSAQNPNGIFTVENHCGPAPDPAGNSAFLRIYENQDSGNAGEGAYASVSWTVPPWVAIIGAGGYTREPGSFNDGWRGRFWAEDFGGNGQHILLQGTNSPNSGFQWSPTSTFAPHLWPFGSWGYYRRFVAELTCMRAAGCDRSGWNDYDVNTMTLMLEDVSPASANFIEGGAPLLSGSWVRGTQPVAYRLFDQGSGLRVGRLAIDGSERQIQDFASRCDRDASQASGEFARTFKPCPEGSQDFTYSLNTASIPDGAHTVSVCAQDYAQWWGDREGRSDRGCDARTIHTDNSPPAAPAGLTVTSSNPARYLTRFGARYTLPADPGSPIVGERYFITDDTQGGKVVVPEKFVAANASTSISGIEGPAAPGAYTLHVALVDQVGFTGAYAAAPIPHDTTPPAAPQGLHVSGPTDQRRVPSFDLAWQNVVDAGAPIDAAHYQVIDADGKVVAETKTVAGQNPEAIAGIQTPAAPGDYQVRVWLSDSEGNVGAPATVTVPGDTTPPAAPQDLFVAPPGSSRSEQGFDLRWRDISDAGSPIAAAHYEVLSPEGKVVVGPEDVPGEGIDSIADLEAPAGRGDYTLRLWLSDAEGNVGAPVSAPLAYECVGSPGAASVRSVSAGFGEDTAGSILVPQGSGASLGGELRGSGELRGAPLCVFDRVVSEGGREFLGLAVTGDGGSYRFDVAAGPSREFTVANRSGQREVSATAVLRTRVRPTLKLGNKVVHEGGFETFRGQIPPPDNDGVVVVLQVRDRNGHWRTFRRYRTRGGGRFSLRYRFTRTSRRTLYGVRAQVRSQSGYPYEAGNSQTQRFVVVP
ncbi:MAG TPA: Ig-like domain repeat protein [Solirubrobacterales bacterium]|nr:Ig-like domain repeat protein [Solirubrobacterales bacterium]